MVIPLPPTPSYNGPLTPEAISYLQYMKYCVIGAYGCALGRFLSSDVFGGLNTLIIGLAGTYLMKDDPSLQSCHDCIEQTPLSVVMGEGGMRCLMPFMTMSLIFGILDLLGVYSMWLRIGSLLPCTDSPICYRAVFLLCAAICEAVACYICWKVHKSLSAAMAEGGAFYDAPDRAAAGNMRAQMAQQQQQARRARDNEPVRESQPAAGFVPFQGAGQRLGEG